MQPLPLPASWPRQPQQPVALAVGYPCRLTSGRAFSTHALFTDQDEILFAAARPIILNGIEDIITRPDLADRAILLMLAPIAERQRRAEHALWRDGKRIRPFAGRHQAGYGRTCYWSATSL
jgi:hypothetical protein